MSSYARLNVTSEIYAETDFNCCKQSDGNFVSKFTFFHPSPLGQTANSQQCPTSSKPPAKDADGDMVVMRRKRDAVEIEHHNSTDLTMVGLQVWRGALLLADYILHNQQQFTGQNVVELGSGVGLTGVAAAMYAKHVTCTDIDAGGILKLIQSNIVRNEHLTRNNMSVLELDFTNLNWSDSLSKCIDETDIVLAADVIYDDDLTDALVRTIDKLLTPNDNSKKKTIYIALEKRYVFTIADLESLAPCYEYFLAAVEKLRHVKKWKLESVPIDFPQYFEYERVKQLVLLRLSAI